MTGETETPGPADRGADDPLRARRFKTARTVSALVIREMTTTYGRSPGGYIWAILEPVGAILVLSLGFSLLLRQPSLGTSFLLFYATGYLPFSLFNTIQNTTSRALNFSKPLLAYPGVTWVDAILARFALNFLTQLLVASVIMTGILMTLDTHAVLSPVAILQAVGLAALGGLGVGTLNCFLLGYIPVWAQIWSIVSRPLLLASGLFYLYEDLPRVARDILWWNPLMHVTGLLRSGFYPTYDAAYVSIPYVAGVSLVVLTLGLVLLGRFHREILSGG